MNQLEVALNKWVFTKSIFVMVILITFSRSAFSFSYNISDDELKLLPKYCRIILSDRVQNPNEHTKRLLRQKEIQKKRNWDIFGPTNSHMHHYCAGFLNINRGNGILGATPQQRQHHYTRAVSEFSYVEQRAHDTFILHYELAYMKGDALSKLGQTTEAINYFQKSLRYKDNYLPAYRALFDYYLQLKMYTEAKSILDKAQSKFPTSSSLKRRRKELVNHQ